MIPMIQDVPGQTLTEKQELLRYYFVDEAMWKQVESIKG